MKKRILKTSIAIVLILNLFVLCSCSSGWSCKKRYVEAEKLKVEKSVKV
jgi:hypothetical protein